MLKTSILILFLTMTMANGALAKVNASWFADNYNSTFNPPSEDERLFDRAKGSVD